MNSFLVRAIYADELYSVIFNAKSITKALKIFKSVYEYDRILSITDLGENIEIELD